MIGSTIPPYPPGLVEGQGVCVAPDFDFQHICDYSVGILEDTDGNPRLLFGAKMAGRDASDEPIWTITDAMPYPVLPDGYSLTIGSCRVQGKDDNSVFAAVRSVDEEWLKDILWAKRYDLETQKFKEQPTADLECKNDGWGL